jgi:ribosomal protein L24
METEKLKNGEQCLVVGGTHKGKSGIVQDLKTSKTGHITECDLRHLVRM